MLSSARRANLGLLAVAVVLCSSLGILAQRALERQAATDGGTASLAIRDVASTAPIPLMSER